MQVFDDMEDYEYFLALLEKASKRENTPLREAELRILRNSVNRQAPLGDEKWQLETATKYGMLSTLNERGRPRKDV